MVYILSKNSFRTSTHLLEANSKFLSKVLAFLPSGVSEIPLITIKDISSK